MSKQFDIIKDSIREILEENKDANAQKIFTTLAMMRLVENNEATYNVISTLIDEVKNEKHEKFDESDVYSILKNPAHLKKVIAESKKSPIGKMTLNMIVELLESEPNEVKKIIGEMNFYMVKTELANGLNMINKQIVGDKDLSEEVYWSRKI